MVNFFFFCGGIALVVGVYFLSRWLETYTTITIYEVTEGILPVDRELLLEVAAHYASETKAAYHAHASRRQLRLDLAIIRDQLQRILTNAARPRNWALNDSRTIKKNKLDYPAEVHQALQRVWDAERALRKLTLWILLRVRLWNISRFHARLWGPVPDIGKLPILKVVELYESVKVAAVALARCYGEAAVGEEIAALL